MTREQIEMFGNDDAQTAFEAARQRSRFEMLISHYGEMKKEMRKRRGDASVDLVRVLLRDALITLILEPCETFLQIRWKLDFILNEESVLEDLTGAEIRIILSSLIGIDGQPPLENIVMGSFMAALQSLEAARDVIRLPCETTGDVVAKAVFLLRKEPCFVRPDGSNDTDLMRSLLTSFLQVKGA